MIESHLTRDTIWDSDKNTRKHRAQESQEVDPFPAGDRANAARTLVVGFPFLDGGVPRSASCRVCVSQLIRFARASSYVADFSARNKLLTQRLLKQGCRCRGLCEVFSKIYGRYCDLISKFRVGLESLLRQGLSEPDFCGDLVYRLKRIVGSNNFSAQFVKIISHYRGIGYNINVLQQTACLVVNPITVGSFAFLFNCTPVGRTSDCMMVPT